MRLVCMIYHKYGPGTGSCHDWHSHRSCFFVSKVRMLAGQLLFRLVVRKLFRGAVKLKTESWYSGYIPQ